MTIEFVKDIMQSGILTTADSCVMDVNELVAPKTWWSMRGESGELMAYDAGDSTKTYGFDPFYESTTIENFMGDIDAILTSSASESMEH